MEKTFDDLIDTLDEFCDPMYTKIIFGATEHGNRDKFYERVKARGNFVMSKIDNKYLDDTFQADDIDMLIIMRKQWSILILKHY